MESPLRWNVVLIVLDQANGETVAPGSPCRTPRLDELAASGVRFHRCHTPTAVCSPARASLMTGLFPSRHGIWECSHTQPPGWVNLQVDPSAFFSHRLAAAGYRTGYFGKWHVEASGRLGLFGWQEFDTSVHAWSGTAIPDSDADVILRNPGYPDYRISGLCEDTGSVGPPPHPAFQRGLDFIRQCARDRQPFCCVIATSEPHDPYRPFQSFWERYDLASAPLPRTLHHAATDKPEVVRRMQRVWASLSDDDWRRIRTAYWAVMTQLDGEVGRVIDELREQSMWDRTIILFTSDHGDLLGAFGLGTKGVGTAYEPVYKIPLIIRWPGGAQGVEESKLQVSLVDLAPTILDLCGLEPLGSVHGRSLRPALEGRPMDPGLGYAEFYGQRFLYTQRIVWHGEWKYVFNPGGVDELYNLREDPEETVNLAGDARHRDTLIEMSRRMWQRMREIGDQSLLRTRYPTLRTAPIGPEG